MKNEGGAMVDRVLINLASIVISGTGIFVVFTKFNVPELRSSYYGEHPFMIKGGAIDRATTWIFTGVAVLGLVLQAVKEIFGRNIPDRMHSVGCYVWFFFGGVVAMMLVVWGLTALARIIARPFWLPKVVDSQREVFSKAVYIVEHNGWRKEQYEKRNSVQNGERLRAANYESVEKSLRQVEKLLDLPRRTGEFGKRIGVLRRYFDKKE
jgi:hypothetical protein